MYFTVVPGQVGVAALQARLIAQADVPALVALVSPANVGGVVHPPVAIASSQLLKPDSMPLMSTAVTTYA